MQTYKTIKTTYINLNDPPLLYKDTIKNYDQEIYIKDIIEHFFKPSNYYFYMGKTFLDVNPYATKALCFCLILLKCKTKV